MAYCPEAGNKGTYYFCYPPSPRSKPLDMLLYIINSWESGCIFSFM